MTILLTVELFFPGNKCGKRKEAIDKRQNENTGYCYKNFGIFIIIFFLLASVNFI
jgi:hypothetical protein